MASTSSRRVRDPRSAHIAVAPAPATISTVTIGPTWVTAPNAAPAPDRSAAPNSRSRMFSVNDTSTVNGIATSSVGDRKSVGEGKSVSVRVDIGGHRIIKKTKDQVTSQERNNKSKTRYI